MSSSKAHAATIISLTEAYDEGNNKRYKKGRFLGKVLFVIKIQFLMFNPLSLSFFSKGGFAHCYELIDVDTQTIYAGKIVPKSMLTKPHQRDKVCA